jgi:hypothetical protein
MGYEIAEQLNWKLPDVILYSPVADRLNWHVGKRSRKCSNSAGSVQKLPRMIARAGSQLPTKCS